MKNILFALIFCIIALSCSGVKNISNVPVENSSFEGWVIYKLIDYKQDYFTDDSWDIYLKEVYGEQRCTLYKNHYKSGQFYAEINTGKSHEKSVYNPIDSLHYHWKVGSDVAKTLNYSKREISGGRSITELDTTAVIHGVICKAIEVSYSIGHETIWYNEDILKINANTYRGSHFEKFVIEKIGCLPILVDNLGWARLELVDFKRSEILDEVFTIPLFKKVTVGITL